MKFSLVAATAVAAVAVSVSAVARNPAAPPAQAPAASGSAFKDLKSKASYALGMNMGQTFKKQGVDLDPEQLSKGMKDAAAGGKALLTEADMIETLTSFQKEMQIQMAAKALKDAADAKQTGAAFLAANKTKAGVKTTATGLQYKVIKDGTGAYPKATDTVTVHYEGKLVDGTVFDSSIKRGQPASFPVNGVIKGWIEALQLMKPGAKWQLFIPSELAYGAEGRPGTIPPNAVLIFDVELISIGLGQ